MEITKRSIPRVASAGLLLGAGCGSDAALPGDVAREFCDTLIVCGYAYTKQISSFDRYSFASTQHCLNSRTAYYDSLASEFDTTASEACGDAFLDFYECVWREHQTYCDYDSALRACVDLAYPLTAFCF